MADLPRRIEIVPWGFWKATTSTASARQQNSGYLGGGNRGTAATVNEYTTWEVLLDAGTWTLTALYLRGTNTGQCSYTLGGTSIGTADHYNGSSLANAVIEFTGITVAAPGWYDLTITCTGKNASSTNYFIQHHLIVLRRTGA